MREGGELGKLKKGPGHEAHEKGMVYDAIPRGGLDSDAHGSHARVESGKPSARNIQEGWRTMELCV